MNRIQKYEFMRNLNDAQFEQVKDTFNRGKCGLMEVVSRIVDILLACGLAYVAYDAVDTLPAVIAGLGTIHLLFKKTISAAISSIIGTASYKGDVDLMKDAGLNINTILHDMKAKDLTDKVDEIHKLETEDK